MTLEEAKQKLWATGKINTLSKVECNELLKEVYSDFKIELEEAKAQGFREAIKEMGKVK